MLNCALPSPPNPPSPFTYNAYAKSLNYFSVTDFGALGDDNTDDTTAIQLAINAAYPCGGVVWFPPGVYRVSRTILIYWSIRLIGSGVQATLIRSTVATQDVLQLQNQKNNFGGLVGVEISNLTMDSAIARTNNAFISLLDNGLSNGSIGSVYLNRLNLITPYIGIELFGRTGNIFIEDVFISNPLYIGIWITPHPTFGGGNNQFIRSAVIAGATPPVNPNNPLPIGIKIEASANINITDTAISGMYDGLNIAGGAIFSSNTFYDTCVNGIHIYTPSSNFPCLFSRFINCETNTASNYGFLIDPFSAANSIDNLVIQGHQSIGNSTVGDTTQNSGMRIGSGTNIKIIGGEFRNYSNVLNNAPVWIDSSVKNCILIGNSFLDYGDVNHKTTLQSISLASSNTSQSLVIVNNILRGSIINLPATLLPQPTTPAQLNSQPYIIGPNISIT